MSVLQSIRKGLTNPAMMERLSKPGFMKWSIAVFIVMNMITWPLFIMFDKKTPLKERRYSAERQFFQELLSLGCHLGIASAFERIGAKFGAGFFPADFQAAAPVRPQNKFNLADMRQKTRNGWVEAGRKNAEIGKLIREANSPETIQSLKEQLVPVNEVVRGSIRAGSIMGSILALVVVAPWINNMVLPYFREKVYRLLGVAADKHPAPDSGKYQAALTANADMDTLHYHGNSPMLKAGALPLSAGKLQATKRMRYPQYVSRPPYPLSSGNSI